MSKTDIADTHTLVMTRRFAAKRELVFAAISQAEHMLQWMCPAGFTVPSAVAELRIGGRYRVQMLPPEGKLVVVAGEYLSIDPPRKLVFTWQWEPEHSMAGIQTTVMIELTEQGSDTLLTMTHLDLPSVEERDSHEHGWTGAYESLGALLATLVASSK